MTVGMLKISPDTPAFRHAQTLLWMVRELHRAGYQRLRARPSLAPSGLYWRCEIVAAVGATERTGYFGGASYSSASKDVFFGWRDAGGKSPQELADMFVERFPDMANAGFGKDQLYADWFANMLAATEKGRLPAFSADFDLKPSEIPDPPPPKTRADGG